jgi:hypothetical protein
VPLRCVARRQVLPGKVDGKALETLMRNGTSTAGADGTACRALQAGPSSLSRTSW